MVTHKNRCPGVTLEKKTNFPPKISRFVAFNLFFLLIIILWWILHNRNLWKSIIVIKYMKLGQIKHLVPFWGEYQSITQISKCSGFLRLHLSLHSYSFAFLYYVFILQVRICTNFVIQHYVCSENHRYRSATHKTLPRDKNCVTSKTLTCG